MMMTPEAFYATAAAGTARGRRRHHRGAALRQRPGTGADPRLPRARLHLARAAARARGAPHLLRPRSARSRRQRLERRDRFQLHRPGAPRRRTAAPARHRALRAARARHRRHRRPSGRARGARARGEAGDHQHGDSRSPPAVDSALPAAHARARCGRGVPRAARGRSGSSARGWDSARSTRTAASSTTRRASRPISIRCRLRRSG